MNAPDEAVPTAKDLKVISIKLIPVEVSGKKLGPWSEEDFPFGQHPLIVACPERYFVYNLHVRVESGTELKNVFIEARLLKNRPVDEKKQIFSFQKKALISPEKSGGRYYYCQFWQWPGSEPGNNYTFWREPDQYLFSDCSFKKYYAQNSPNPEWTVHNERSFPIDLL